MFDRVLYYFKKICSIPHGSGNTALLSDYCEQFAKEHSLRFLRDETGNVIIFKKASVGYENSAPVILQGHLDMVCVKKDGCNINFETDGLEVCEDEEYIWANGTSLGGDDGIAVAYVLAVLESDTLKHPAIEAVFTTDEETGMFGATALDCSPLSGKMLINIDSEEEGTLLVSCAGGVRADCEVCFQQESAAGTAYEITLAGLCGGHSGTEIHKGRLNAIVALAKILAPSSTLRLCSISGGSADNVIASACKAKVVCSDIEKVNTAFEKLKNEYAQNEPDMSLEVKKVAAESAISHKDTTMLLQAIASVPNGVVAFSKSVKGLVETSLNIGVISSCGGKIKMSHALRSSVSLQKALLEKELASHWAKIEAKTAFHSSYPAWEYKENSVLRQTVKDAYLEQTGKEMNITAIHAGLECGIFCGKIEGLDCVSMGPDIYDIHSFDERLSKKSAENVFCLLLSVLEKLK